MARKMHCGHCGYKWLYTGSNEYYATCPHCLQKVKVPDKRGVKTWKNWKKH
jgi:DNA-directed RNA polymerase subunit RPC12/RpoP